MSTQPMKRQYIMLKPMVLGANGFARLEMEGGGLLLQLTGKNLTGHARGFGYFCMQGRSRPGLGEQGQSPGAGHSAGRKSVLARGAFSHPASGCIGDHR